MTHKSEKIGRDGDTIETWSGLTKDSEGEPLEISTSVRLFAHMLGEPSGAIVGIEGSNMAKPTDEDFNWAPLPEGMLGNSIKQIGMLPRWIRPAVEGGDENTDVSVLIAVRKV